MYRKEAMNDEHGDVMNVGVLRRVCDYWMKGIYGGPM